MSKMQSINEFDIVFISYDEPNADENYNDLINKAPWAKRSHGVFGSDAAHKAAADLAETDRFITIDGDNIIDQTFLNQEIDFNQHADLEKSVISWTAKNTINGLIYGNGGIKCWPKQFVLNMRTHENADPKNEQAQVDFCWDVQYIQMNGIYSEIMNNATPQQAWRAGFREGVKMTLDRGLRPNKVDLLKGHWKNLHRLYIWLMVGADTKNGLWAIYGAREGLYKTMCTDWNFINVRDFEYLNNLWKEIEPKVSMDGLEDSIEAYGIKLIKELEIPIAESPLNIHQSKFFKTVYQNPSRNAKQQFVIDPE